MIDGRRSGAFQYSNTSVYLVSFFGPAFISRSSYVPFHHFELGPVRLSWSRNLRSYYDARVTATRKAKHATELVK